MRLDLCAGVGYPVENDCRRQLGEELIALSVDELLKRALVSGGRDNEVAIRTSLRFVPRQSCVTICAATIRVRAGALGQITAFR